MLGRSCRRRGRSDLQPKSSAHQSPPPTPPLPARRTRSRSWWGTTAAARSRPPAPSPHACWRGCRGRSAGRGGGAPGVGGAPGAKAASAPRRSRMRLLDGRTIDSAAANDQPHAATRVQNRRGPATGSRAAQRPPTPPRGAHTRTASCAVCCASCERTPPASEFIIAALENIADAPVAALLAPTAPPSWRPRTVASWPWSARYCEGVVGEIGGIRGIGGMRAIWGMRATWGFGQRGWQEWGMVGAGMRRRAWSRGERSVAGCARRHPAAPAARRSRCHAGACK